MSALSPRPELWEQQARNRRNTVLVIAAFLLLLLVLGLGVDFFLWGRMGEGATGFVPIAASLALLVGLLQALGGYYWGDQAVLAATHARPADPGDPREQTLINVVQELRLACGLPTP